MELHENVNFITSESRQLIANYVKANLNDDMQAKWEDYLPRVSEKVQTICVDWLKNVREGHASGQIDRNSRVYGTVGIEGLNLLCNVFQSKTNIRASFKIINDNTLIGLTINRFISLEKESTSNFRMTFLWSPLNPYVNPCPLIPVEYIPNHPDSLSETLFQEAVQGKNTDIKIVSCGDEPLHFHAKALTVQSPYFKRMLESGFQEEETGVINLDYPNYSIEEFRHYIYKGSVSQEVFLNTARLIDCLMMAHQYEMKPLFDQCACLLMNSILKDPAVDADLVLHLISCIFLCNESRLYPLPEELFDVCLKRAEVIATNLDADESSIGWDRLDKNVLTKLFKLAIRLDLTAVETGLTNVIDDILSPQKHPDHWSIHHLAGVE